MVGPLRSHLLGNPRASRVRYFEHMLISACATPVAISNLVVLVDGDVAGPIDRAARA